MPRRHRSGLSARQAVTLASLVEKETARADERTDGVGGLPQPPADQDGPAVRSDRHLRPRTRRALHRESDAGRPAFDSPYNTYRYAGLPPGPIASPGRASLEAAVHPDAVDFVYFVSRNDGSHAFASTLDEHNRNVHKFQVQYFKAKHWRLAARRSGLDSRSLAPRARAPTPSAQSPGPATPHRLPPSRLVPIVRPSAASRAARRSSCGRRRARGASSAASGRREPRRRC